MRENYYWLGAVFLKEKYYWLVADKPDEPIK
jgi:hypothetical protein